LLVRARDRRGAPAPPEAGAGIRFADFAAHQARLQAPA
jgi:hypothetical protein